VYLLVYTSLHPAVRPTAIEIEARSAVVTLTDGCASQRLRNHPQY
jgi:hypothetical protein